MPKPTCEEVKEIYEKLLENRYSFTAEFDFWNLSKILADKKQAVKFMNEGKRLFSLFAKNFQPLMWTEWHGRRMRFFEADACRKIIDEINIDVDEQLRNGVLSVNAPEEYLPVKADFFSNAFISCGVEGLFELRLRHAPITRIPPSVAKLVDLQTLALDGTKVSSLAGLEKLKNLKVLRLARTCLKTTEGIEKIPSLIEIDLRGSLVSNVSGLADLPNLKYLDLEVSAVDWNSFPEEAKRLLLKLGNNFIH